MAASYQQVASLTAFKVRIERKIFMNPRGGDHLAISRVEFEIGDGEFICLLGPTGSGKTATLNIISGLDADFEGEVCFADPDARSRLAYIFQNPRLLPWRTLFENIRLPIKRQPDAAEAAEMWLQRVGLNSFRDIYPGHASLGMQRLAALARGFATRPTILLMDEPFVSLDERTASDLRDLLLGLWRQKKLTVLFVTHDVEEAMRLATRILVYSAAPARVMADIAVPREDGSKPGALLSETSIRRELESALSRELLRQNSPEEPIATSPGHKVAGA